MVWNTKFSQIAFATLLLICLLDMPYGYYEFVRFAGMVVFGVLAYTERKNKAWMVFWGASALLINPFIKIHLGRTIWNILDVIWAVVLIMGLFIRKDNKEIEKNIDNKEEKVSS